MFNIFGFSHVKEIVELDWFIQISFHELPNTERYGVSLHIQTECGKIRTRKNSVFGHISHSDVIF